MFCPTRIHLRYNTIILASLLVPTFLLISSTTCGKHSVLPSNMRKIPPSEDIESFELTKYSYLTPHGLESLMKLELGVYLYVENLYYAFRNQTTSPMRQEFDKTNKNVFTYLHEFKESATIAFESSEGLQHHTSIQARKMFWNPLALYKMVGRVRNYVQTWAVEEPVQENELITSITSYLTQVYNISDGPTERDHEAAMFSLLNIHYVYQLPVRDIASGYVDGVNVNISLNAKDCYLIGKYGMSRKFFTSGIEWLEHALSLAKNTSDDSLAYVDADNALITSKRLYRCYFNPFSQYCVPPEGNLRKLNQHRATETTNYLDIRMWGICKGKIKQAEEEQSGLFCWYERKIHPSFEIGPIKSELHSMHPKLEIVQYYDVVQDRDMESLKNIIIGKFETSTYKDNGATAVNPLERPIIYAFANEFESEASMQASKIIERLTGLKAVNRTGLDLRLHAYSPGNHPVRHIDTIPNQNLATFMFYLSDVIRGGETAFTRAGASVMPRKGSAVFWYNLFSCGNVDELSEHGGCPVIFGEKWVGVKLINYIDQSHRQCHLKRKIPYEVLVNGKSKYNA